ncbi:hypothetical protein Hanom_Chr13g01218331 [Helianthus anomalus]
MSKSKEKSKDTCKKTTCSHVPAWEKKMNVACYLSDPPKGFEIYKSMIDNATAKKGDVVIKSKVQGKEVSISEQVVREVLLFGDEADDLVEYPKEKFMDGFLAHIYLVCISGNKSGLDKLTLKQTSGVVSVVEGWKYNYSKSMFDDMMDNVKTINEKYWYKFPRFVQLILEKKYPKLPINVKTYNVKMMNYLVFTMLNQRSRDNVKINYKNKGEPAQIKAIVAKEHDVEIIEAPVGNQEPVKIVDLTSVESEEDIADDRMIEDDEVNDDVDEKEIETLAEGLTTEIKDVNEPVHMSPPHVEPVTTTETADADHS